MSFMDWIVQRLNEQSSYFYSIYLKVIDWVWPFWMAAPLFLYVCYGFNELAWQFYYFSNWVSDVSSKIGNYLSWSTIWSYILSYVPNLTSIRDWFYGWWGNVTSVITTWWNVASVWVHDWISTATQGLSGMLVAWSNFWNTTWPQWTSKLNTVKAAWDNFVSVTLPGIPSWLGIDSWFRSRVKELEPFWRDWQDMRSQVVGFFNDPVEFIWSKFTDWFLGPEG